MPEMAPLLYFLGHRKVILAVHLVLFLFASRAYDVGASLGSSEIRVRSKTASGFTRRMLLELGESEEEEPIVPKKKQPTITTSLSPKNETKLLKQPSSGGLSSKNQTKLLKPTNSTKTVKSAIGVELKKLNSTSTIMLKNLNSTSTIKLKKLNSTSTIKLKNLNSTSNSKSSNSTKTSPLLTKKTSDLIKSGSPKNKTSRPTSSQEAEIKKSPKKSQETEQDPKKPKTQKPKQKQPSWVDQEEDDDLVKEFRDLPARFQQTLIPDLERISTTSKAYITKANKQMTKGFKPYVGNKYAPMIASVVSCAFILIPLLLVSLIFNRIKAYFSLQKLLIFIQIYLSIYFSILCLSSLVTGLEPLRFFYTTAPSTYVCIQVMQTLGYVLYLLMLLVYLVLVFSTDCGLGPKFLGLAQTFVGYAVGLHYYVAVFHRMVLHQPPKTTWKVHGVYATCFLVICLSAQAERRKKAYMEDGGEEGKKS